ncbi:MAG TPA: HAMP domain-containing sensor histidine kinase [Candidatus Binatia bacterium]|nr:HAMP domain-containing sensor histidine kinase [Candidatus Binatia bacterium]
MPRSLSARITLAFIGVALVAWLAIGATLFVLLRALHTESTGTRLEDQATSLVAQARQDVVSGDAQGLVADIRTTATSEGLMIFVVTVDGRIVAPAGVTAPAAGTFVVDPGGRDASNHGTATLPDGTTYAYAATVIRPNATAGARALVVATPDRSGRDALGDLLATLPAVILVTLLVGAPIAWFVARSVSAPLRRLAAATADVPTTVPVAPLPLEGPTEVRELTGRFNAMTAALSETRERETELLANLRHDLRTPLTVIRGFADALADGTAAGDDAVRAAHAISEESARLERLVDELGSIERLRAGTAGLRPEPLDARIALRETAERFAPSAAAAGIELLVVGEAASGTDDLSFAADRLAVDRMLGNLVRNALAAVSSPGGHVWLDARLLQPARQGEPAGVALSVTDDGPGFSPGTTERVFERFYRADPARSGSSSGLGLAIVRELAEAHGGTAHAEQVAPHGARVSVILPRVPRVRTA